VSEAKQYWKAGATAEMLVQIDLTRFGLNVSKAGDGLPYDILAEKNGKVLRIQVKSTHQLKTKSSFAFRTSRRGDKTYNKDEADIFALVNPDGCIIYKRLEVHNPANIYIKKEKFNPAESEKTKENIFNSLLQNYELYRQDAQRERLLIDASARALEFFWDLEKLSESMLCKLPNDPSFFQCILDRAIKAYPETYLKTLFSQEPAL
jgi:hypothetical protein